MKKLSNEQVGALTRIIVLILILVAAILSISSCKRAPSTLRHEIQKKEEPKLRAFEIVGSGKILMLEDSLNLWKAGPLIVRASTYNSDPTKYTIWGILREDGLPEDYYYSFWLAPNNTELHGDSVLSSIDVQYFTVKRVIL